ncbi:MAG: hypothetical protein K6G73_12855 [Marinilabiliaceae bacterium]|nr:hypothetical protein [Marinilabiliaceae bacterium]
MNIRDAIRNIAGTPSRSIILGYVTAVKDDTVDVQPYDETAAPLLDIDLQVGDTGGLVFRPEVGATVLVAMDSDTTGFVINAGAGNININGGSHGAVVSIEPLVEKLNALENDLNDLRTVFNNWTPVAQDGGAALKTAVGSWASQSLAVTQTADIADDRLSH